MSTDTTTRPTVDDLRFGLPQVLDSPQDEGLVEMLVVRPAEDVRETPPTVAVSFVNLGPGKDLRLRGIYARVVESGSIAVGDRIRRL